MQAANCTAAAPQASRLLRPPQEVLLLAANEFLKDADANRLAQCCNAGVRALQRYAVKKNLPLSCVGAFAAAASSAHQHSSTPAAAAPASLRSRWRFGAISSVVLKSDPGEPTDPAAMQTAFDQCGPRSVKRVCLDRHCELSLSGVRFPPSVTSIYMDAPSFEWPWPLAELVLPPALTELRLPLRFKHPLAGLQLPQSLLTLVLGKCEHSLRELELPAGLREFAFGSQWDFPASELPCFPSGLETLRFPPTWNEPLTGFVFPASLRSLVLGERWNQQIDFLLPPALTHLVLSDRSGDFDQSLRHVRWPESLTTLELGHKWTQPPAEFSFPPHLTGYFDCPTWAKGVTFDGLALPAGVQSLRLSSSTNSASLRDVGFVLPSGLLTLELDAVACAEFASFALPPGLQTLVCRRGFAGFGSLAQWIAPDSLTELDLSGVSGVDGSVLLTSIRLPRGLRLLQSRGAISFRGMHLGRWPDSLETIDSGLNHPLRAGELPPSLTRLTLTYWCQPSPAQDLILPSQLRILNMGFSSKAALTGMRWPKSLEELTLSQQFNHLPTAATLPLPPRLRVLRFVGEFNQPIDDLPLPDSLEHLSLIARDFAHSLHSFRFPPRLRVLQLGSGFRHDAANLPKPGSLPHSLREIRTLHPAAAMSAWAEVGLPDHCAIVS